MSGPVPNDDAEFFGMAEFFSERPPDAVREAVHDVEVTIRYQVFGREDHVRRSLAEIQRVVHAVHPEAEIVGGNGQRRRQS